MGTTFVNDGTLTLVNPGVPTLPRYHRATDYWRRRGRAQYCDRDRRTGGDPVPKIGVSLRSRYREQ